MREGRLDPLWPTLISPVYRLSMLASFHPDLAVTRLEVERARASRESFSADRGGFSVEGERVVIVRERAVWRGGPRPLAELCSSLEDAGFDLRKCRVKSLEAEVPIGGRLALVGLLDGQELLRLEFMHEGDPNYYVRKKLGLPVTTSFELLKAMLKEITSDPDKYRVEAWRTRGLVKAVGLSTERLDTCAMEREVGYEGVKKGLGELFSLLASSWRYPSVARPCLYTFEPLSVPSGGPEAPGPALPGREGGAPLPDGHLAPR